jgi:serine/threonine protein kinase
MIYGCENKNNFAFQVGVTYLNLKSTNVLLDKRGHVVLTDFGTSVNNSTRRAMEEKYNVESISSVSSKINV